MTCEEFGARLTAFSLGELDPKEAELARAHVARCSECAASALRDRQLTALLRASAVPAPGSLRRTVAARLRASAAPPSSRRHWLALGVAAGLAAVVMAAAVLLVPAPDSSGPLGDAWSLYRSERPIRPEGSQAAADRLAAVLGPAAATPDLSSFGLAARASGARTLSGHLAAFTEYADARGGRLTLLRWRGDLPRAAHRPADAGQELEIAYWGRTGSMWWERLGVVWCLIGTVERETLYRVAEHLAGRP